MSKSEAWLKNAIEYGKALRSEILAQEVYIKGNMTDACRYYQEATKSYEATGDYTSAKWCECIGLLLDGTILIFRQDEDGFRKLTNALNKIPKELEEELESHKEKLFKGINIPEDKKMLTLLFPLIKEYEKNRQRLLEKVGRSLETIINDYIKYEGYDIICEPENRTISREDPFLSEEERTIISKYGDNVEMDILARNRKEKRILVGEVKTRAKPVGYNDMKKFVEIAPIFIKKMKVTFADAKRKDKWYISLTGFDEGAQKLAREKNVIIFDKEELISRMRDKGAEWHKAEGIDG